MITERKLKSIFKRAKFSKCVTERLAQKLSKQSKRERLNIKTKINRKIRLSKKKRERKSQEFDHKNGAKLRKGQKRKLSKKAKRAGKNMNQILTLRKKQNN